MKKYVMILGAVLAGSCLSEEPPPNVVIIFADDLGYTDLGCFGAERWKTPHLDRLADEGMKFSNFHVGQAVCSASRAALLTGRYPQRSGIKGALFPWSTNGLPESETTLAELFKSRGYATGMVGKWHLGHLPEYLPVNHGFDEWLGLPYSNDMWPVDFDGVPVPEGHRKKKYPPLPLMDGLETVETVDTLEDQGMLTLRYTERAVDFIRRSKERPFFLYFAHSMPHVPIYASPRFLGKSGAGLYGDMMMEIDWSVGEIIGALEEAGVADNTLVVFTSDNGPWLNFGDHSGTCDGLREGKGTAFEGGMRVPCIMRWPAGIPAGKTCDEFASALDLFPTLGKVIDAPMPETKLDGMDISPLLAGDSELNGNREFWYYFGTPLCAVSDGRWKLVLPHRHRSYVGVEPENGGHPGRYAKGKAVKALYDMDQDMAESIDLQHEYPEIVERLEVMAARARAELGDVKKGEKK